MVFRLRYAVDGTHTEHEILGGLLHGHDGLVLIDYHAVAHHGGDVFIQIAHIAVAHAVDAGMSAGAEAHVVLEPPVFHVMPRLVARDREIRYLVLLKAVVLERVHGVKVHIRLLVLIRDKRRAEIAAIHGRALLEL